MPANAHVTLLLLRLLLTNSPTSTLLHHHLNTPRFGNTLRFGGLGSAVLILVRLRWPGTDLEAGFVIYAENGPRKVFGVSLGVRMSTPNGISQIPGASGRGTPVAPPAAAHAPLRRPVGGGEVACE